MAKKIIDPQLAEALRANPNVEKVRRKRLSSLWIHYMHLTN